jgi:hypothetical protein
MHPLGKNWISYSDSSMDQATILPAKSDLPKTCLMENLDFTTTLCPWKYGLSFLAVMTTAKASHSIF